MVAAKDPAYDLHPGRCMEALLRTKRLPPEQFQLTNAEKEEKAKQPPPEAPVVTAAKIRAESAEKIAQSHDQLAGQKNQNDLDRDTAYNDSMARRDQSREQYEERMMLLKVRLAELDYANQQQISLTDAKVALARDTMKLSLQRELAGADGKGPQVATPEVEPAGRAPEGEAFQK